MLANESPSHMGAFQNDVFALTKLSESAHKPFKHGTLFPIALCPICMPYWISKPDILGAHLSSAGTKG